MVAVYAPTENEKLNPHIAPEPWVAAVVVEG